VVSNAEGSILISERKPDCAYAGQWEFPGGKCEPGEDVQSALVRELHEELGIQVESARPLIRLSHRYPDRHVLLDTWMVTAWRGHAHAREGQRFEWVRPADLNSFPMLAANQPILRAVQLPPLYLITPEPEAGHSHFLNVLEHSLGAGVRMLRLRAPKLTATAYEALARQCLSLCRNYGAQLLLDREPELVQQLGADGLHLNSVALACQRERPIATDHWLAASCHDRAELEQALKLGVDFAVLGPLAATPTHPRGKGLGWQNFARLVGELALPVYGIGGLGVGDLEVAWRNRAQGVAAIRGLWLP
jgi:8-oxo-dGTP diphosphatase